MNLKLAAFAAITLTFAGSAFANDASLRDTRSHRDGTYHEQADHRAGYRKARIGHRQRMRHDIRIEHDRVTLLDTHGNPIPDRSKGDEHRDGFGLR